MENKLALIFDPYLDTLGGGERYTLTVAEILSEIGYQVIVAWPNDHWVKDAQDRFGLSLKKITVDEQYYRLFISPISLIEKRKSLMGFDLCFFVSDGSVPFLFSKNNILHYQVPFTKVNGFKLLNTLKLRLINHLVVNSNFTKEVIDSTFGTPISQVLYPPVDTTSLTSSTTKQKVILNVGRFASPSHSKRQDVLIHAFRTLVDNGLKDWRLVLAGGLSKDNNLNFLKDSAKGYPISFVTSPDYGELKKIYSTASIYWHAAGYQVDEKLNPEAVEHFGITTVESMAAGCVPVVINKGGQKEIVNDKCGRLWDEIPSLLEHTKALIKSPPTLKRLSIQAIKRSADFSTENFKQNLISITNK